MSGLGHCKHGTGRVYLGPEPEGPHPGYRGALWVDGLGIHITTYCEYLLIIPERPEGEWVPVGQPTLIPWHRVDCIEWGIQYAADGA